MMRRVKPLDEGLRHMKRMGTRFQRLLSISLTALLVTLFTLSVLPISAVAAPLAPVADDWPTYMHDTDRSGASADTYLSVANASQLAKRWQFQTGDGIAASPVVVNGVVYIGSWDGYEYALDANTGALKWKTFLGQSINNECIPATIGVTSSATVLNGVVYVGGGDAFWYALDANTGNVLWKINTGDNSAIGGHYNWSSPLIYNGFAYIGIASNCDDPLVQGKLWKVNLQTHQLDKVFDAVPPEQVGGGIWTTPVVDPQTNTLYITTGTQSLTTQTYSQAIVALDTTTLAVKSSWQIPFDQAGIDLDWGTSPVFYKDANGNKRVTAINKDGFIYSYDAANLAAGPVWEKEIAITGSCPPCGNGSVSTSAFGNGLIYVAGGNTTINGKGYKGSVRALNATTGAIVWEHGTDDPVIPALAYVNGLVIDAAGPTFEVLNAATGERLYSYETAGVYAPAAVSKGFIYTGGLDGKIYGFALPVNQPPVPPADPNCPAGWTCQNIQNALPVGTEAVANGTWNVTAGGAGVLGNADQFRYISQVINGDKQLTTRVTALPGAAVGAQAGLMIRQTNEPGSPYYAVFLKPGNVLTVQYRANFDGAPVVAKVLNGVGVPKYLRLIRVGDDLQAATSADGANYTLVPGSSVNLSLPAKALFGVMTSSGVNNTGAVATYTNIAFAAPTFPPSTPPATACPANWNCADVGNPALVGNQGLNAGVWTLSGAGTNIANFKDQFHFVWQPLAANGTVSARVTAQTNTDPGAKAGVMLRQNANRDAPYYAAFLTPNGVVTQYRTLPGQNTTQITTDIGNAKPVYLRVERYNDANNGTVLATFTSNDGANWTYVQGTTTSFNLNGQILAGLAVSSVNAGALSNATFDNVLVSNVAPPPPTLCPNGWSCLDIANSFPFGNQEVNGDTWVVQAGGSDIWALGDQFRFMWQTHNADTSVSAHITALTDTDPWAKAGVMLRQSTRASSPYYAAFVTGENGVSIQYRLTLGGDTRQILIPGAVPVYLKVARSGNIFTTYTSNDGTTWTPVPGSSLTLKIPGAILSGIAATAHTTAALTTARFENVTVTDTAPVPPTACPATWTCTDIGDPLLLGSQLLANNAWSVQGGGTDIWGTADQFHYISQAATGDTTVSAHITAQTYSDPWAKAGVMLRETTAADSAYYGIFVTHDNGIVVQQRATTGATTTQIAIPGTVPAYIRVARSGTTYTAYTSADGLNWNPVANSSIRLNLPNAVQAGLAVTGHSDANIGNINADNFTIDPTAPAPPSPNCPANWTCEDVGHPTQVGSQNVVNGVWTVNGGGADIWGTTDQFRYISKNITGDGSVSARVTSQTYTDPWAKAGVMFRSSNDAGAPYYALFVTHDNGVSVQYRLTQGGNTTQVGVNGTLPLYLKVARVGTTYTAYTSADGTTWTPVPGSAVNVTLDDPTLAGVVVNSHNATTAGTVTFEAVTVTQGGQVLLKTSASTCPTSWSCTSVDTVSPKGKSAPTGESQNAQEQSRGLQGSTDKFQYTWQSLQGNGVVSARVTVPHSTGTSVQAGVMIRQSTQANSAYYGAFVAPDGHVYVQYRSAQGAQTVQVQGPVISAAQFLKIERSGNIFTAYVSQDGVHWQLLAGSTVKLTLKGSLLAGSVVANQNGIKVDALRVQASPQAKK